MKVKFAKQAIYHFLRDIVGDIEAGTKLVFLLLAFSVEKCLPVDIKTFLNQGRLVECIKYKMRPSGNFRNGSKINGH